MNPSNFLGLSYPRIALHSHSIAPRSRTNNKNKLTTQLQLSIILPIRKKQESNKLCLKPIATFIQLQKPKFVN
jgi:hypothetical protein